MTPPLSPPWGIQSAHPDGAPAIWGARMICQTRWIGGKIIPDVTRLGDRQGFAGDPAAVESLNAFLNSPAEPVETYQERRADGKPRKTKYLKGTVMEAVHATAIRFLMTGHIDTRKAGAVCLYRDDRGIVMGDTNASHGYLYVAAWEVSQ